MPADLVRRGTGAKMLGRDVSIPTAARRVRTARRGGAIKQGAMTGGRRLQPPRAPSSGSELAGRRARGEITRSVMARRTLFDTPPARSRRKWNLVDRRSAAHKVHRRSMCVPRCEPNERTERVKPRPLRMSLRKSNFAAQRFYTGRGGGSRLALARSKIGARHWPVSSAADVVGRASQCSIPPRTKRRPRPHSPPP